MSTHPLSEYQSIVAATPTHERAATKIRVNPVDAPVLMQAQHPDGRFVYTGKLEAKARGIEGVKTVSCTDVPVGVIEVVPA